MKKNIIKYAYMQKNSWFYLSNDSLEPIWKFLLEWFPDFFKYLNNQKPEDYYVNIEISHAYILFWDLTRYFEEKIKLNQTEEVIKILKFINNLYRFKNEDIDTLISLGFLENLDHFKSVLPELIKLFPKEMYNDFMKNYSNYLD